MKLLKFDEGGRPRANDDLATLQDEVYVALQATLVGAPPMVLSGCAVTSANGLTGSIGPGLLWLGGAVQRYSGAGNVTFPVEVAAGAYVESDFRAYQTGGTKACMMERALFTQAGGTATGGALGFTARGALRTYRNWLEAQTCRVGKVEWLANYEPSEYDGSGLGYAAGLSAGWALCNGQNGTADLRARFIVAVDPDKADYDTIGKTGGEERHQLTIAEMPPHNHKRPVSNPGAVGDGNTLAKSNNRNGGTDDFASSTTGGGQAHENRPPYYVLVARQWIGF